MSIMLSNNSSFPYNHEIHKLDNNYIIGLDLDLTLINAANSELLQHWVRKNYKGKDIWIVTFRTDLLLDKVWLELAKVKLYDYNFKGILSIPSELYNLNYKYQKINSYKYYNKLKYFKYLNKYNISENDIQYVYNLYINWKGKICKKYNITILVDDDENMVLTGCKKYGIEFINTRNL